MLFINKSLSFTIINKLSHINSVIETIHLFIYSLALNIFLKIRLI